MNYFIQLSMINELLTSRVIGLDEIIVVLGNINNNKLFYKQLQKNKRLSKKCQDIKAFKKILMNNRNNINQSKYVFVITDSDYIKWQILLNKYEVTMNKSLILPLYLVRRIKE